METQTQQPLVCPAHTTQYIGTIIIGIIIGAGALYAYTNKTGNTYLAGFEAAKKSVLESPAGMILRTSDDMRTLLGTVTAVNGSRITLNTRSLSPFEDTALAERTIIVTTDTKISKLSQKDPNVMQSEMEVFMKAMQASKGGAPTTSPEPFTRTPATIAGIAVGDMLNVIAAENIKAMKEFSVSEIQIQARAMPLTPAVITQIK